MPKRYGVKEQDLVVAHVRDLLLTGRLRSGDRVDLMADVLTAELRSRDVFADLDSV